VKVYYNILGEEMVFKGIPYPPFRKKVGSQNRKSWELNLWPFPSQPEKAQAI
jgi:hypothetical protein